MVKSLLFGLTVGSVGTLVAMQYHLIRTDERFVIVSRAHQPPLRSAYVDIRRWSPAMWEHYPELQEAITKAGRQDLLTAHSSSTAPDSGGVAPFQGVSRTGETPVFTASDARKTVIPPAAPRSLPPEASSLPGSPRIALEMPVPPLAPLSGSPTQQQSMTIIPSVPPLPQSTLDMIPETAESLLKSMQRTVPSPEETPPSVAADNSITSPAEAGAHSPKIDSRPDWMQSLLRTIVPGATSPTGTEATTSQLSPRTLPGQNTTPQPSSPRTTVTGSGTGNPPASPRQIPPAAASPFKQVPQTEDRNFPATPRRIYTTSVQEI